jgi:hypothetical protein
MTGAVTVTAAIGVCVERRRLCRFDTDSDGGGGPDGRFVGDASLTGAHLFIKEGGEEQKIGVEYRWRDQV